MIVVRGDAVGQRLVGQHQAVAQDVGGDLAEVLRQRVLAAAHERERPAGEDHVDRRARAGAEGDVAREVAEPDRGDVARGVGELHRVLDQRRIDEHRVGRALQPGELRGVDRPAGRLERGGHPLDDHELLGGRRVVDQHLEHEAVDLRLGQRVGALRLDRVLGRHHEERIGQRDASRGRS